MKSVFAAKMSSMRKRSALSSSAASSAELTPAREAVRVVTGIPSEPSSHHGKMRVCFDGSTPPSAPDASEEIIDIILCIAVDSVHAVSDADNSIVFEADFSSIKEIVWDHTEGSVYFVLENGIRSSSFLFVSTLVEIESQLTKSLRSSGLPRLPDQAYVGVLVGRNLPSSPIHQRRASVTGSGAQLQPSLPAAVRRELLIHERPPRSISPRETLAIQYFRSGKLSFPCSINGDARGLKLDGNFLYVFPSPDCHERSACLFSYQYEQVDACDVRGGVRLELRFRRSGAKQPTFIAFQSPDALYIRDAIWYFQHDVSMDEYFRRMSSLPKASSTPILAGQAVPSVPLRSVSGRRNSLKSFKDEDALECRIHSRCIVIGCNQRCADQASATFQSDTEIASNGAIRPRKIWYCEEHALAPTEPGSPPRSPSKRSGLLSRGKSFAALTSLVHSKHYTQSVKYHGTLLKSGGKYQLTKAWNQKIVALIDTPLGGFLCYYDKLSHCPGQSESTARERRVIDLSSVVCVRRESAAATGSQTQPYAFDVVTVYRAWTFAASDIQEYEVWLSVLGAAIEKQSSMSPDKPLRFPVKCLRDPLHNLPSRNDGTTAVEVSPNGVTVISGTDGDSEVYNWYFTDIQKWSVAKQHDNSACCFISCAVDPVGPMSSQSGVSSRYQDFLFHTPDAEAICSAIEFFVGRCMAKLETLAVMYMHSQTRQQSRRSFLETAPQKPSSEAAADEKTGKGPSTKEHTLAAVQLRPVGFVPPTLATARAEPNDSGHQIIELTSMLPSIYDTHESPDSYPSPPVTDDDQTSRESVEAVPKESGVWVKYLSPPTPAECRDLKLTTKATVSDVVKIGTESPPEADVVNGPHSSSCDRLVLSSLDSIEESATAVQTSSNVSSSIPIAEAEVINESDEWHAFTAHAIHNALAPTEVEVAKELFQEASLQQSDHSRIVDGVRDAPVPSDDVVASELLHEGILPQRDSPRSGESDDSHDAPVPSEVGIASDLFTDASLQQRDSPQIAEGTLEDSIPSGDEVTRDLLHETKQPLHDLTSHEALMNCMPQLDFCPEDHASKCINGLTDGDNDRFESFQYCECTVGIADDVETRAVRPTPNEQEIQDGLNDADVGEDDEFEDAKCDSMDTTEISFVVLDGCSGNEEDSVIMMEDEETGTHDVDIIDGLQPLYDPVDEISPSQPEDSSDIVGHSDDLPSSADSIDSTTQQATDCQSHGADYNDI